jgi:glucokinase
MSNAHEDFDAVVLAGDVGGTNTNLALVGRKGNDFKILIDRHYKTQKEKSFLEPLSKFIEEAKREQPKIQPTLCCVSGAGPVNRGYCTLTNAPWDISASEIEAAFKFKTFVINDFTAVAYGVVLLDAENPKEITVFKHVDGTLPKADAGAKLVVGAGTGLGVGYLNQVQGRYIAYPSEGGHALLPVFDEEAYRFSAWLAQRYGFAPGAEAAVSGQGIANGFAFVYETGVKPRSAAADEVAALPEDQRPAEVAKRAAHDELCRHVMERFVLYYARVSADLSVIFMPSGGLYLAGGIAAKNLGLFTKDSLFMKTFEQSYREHTRDILKSTPVYVSNDYSISLLGAANAAVSLS